MNRVAFFVLALVAVAIGDGEKDMEELAKTFETDVQTVQACLSEAGTDIMEMRTSEQKWIEINPDGEIDEEIKKTFTKYSSFLACMLEKQDMMKDSKLVLDKILVSIKNDKDLQKPPNEEFITECVNTLNENSEMTREDRSLGLLICVVGDQEEKRR